MIQNPLNLSRRKVCIYDKPCLFPDHLRIALLFQLITVFCRTPALPYDSIAYRLSGLLIPYDGRLPLIGNAQRGNIL